LIIYQLLLQKGKRYFKSHEKWKRRTNWIKRRKWIFESEPGIWKKAKSLNPRKRVKNKEKTKVIMELRQNFPSIKLKIWLKISNLPMKLMDTEKLPLL
jgi:hypothetical protein